jgi:hypothetical protein
MLEWAAMRMSRAAQHIRSAPAACLVVGLICAGGALAQESAPPGVDLKSFAAKRFPQPVRVGDLIHRTVLEPVESRRILGQVAEVVRLDGAPAIVMTFGGFLGFGRHQIAVPLDAMVLLGDELEVLDFTPQQLERFPVYDGSGSVLGPEEIIHMGLAHPSH